MIRHRKIDAMSKEEKVIGTQTSSSFKLEVGHELHQRFIGQQLKVGLGERVPITFFAFAASRTGAAPFGAPAALTAAAILAARDIDAPILFTWVKFSQVLLPLSSAHI